MSIMLSALIVDDEPFARAHLRDLLECQGLTQIEEADSATRALQLAEDLRPDVIMLDIQMPGLNGMQLAGALAQMDPSPILVFVTGYSEYAVDAFDHDAVDYLVKPVSADRVAKALVRVQACLSDRFLRERAQQHLVSFAGNAQVLKRLPVRVDYVVRLIRIEQILCAVAREKRVFVRTAEGEFRTYYRLTQLESLLPAESFLRIHDSCLVRLDAVEDLVFLGSHTREVRLSDGSLLPIGRTRYPELQRRLGLIQEP
jgi:two-component system, LytTR family, response regulator